MIAHEIIGDDLPAVVPTLGAGAAHCGSQEETRPDPGGTLGAIGNIIGGDR